MDEWVNDIWFDSGSFLFFALSNMQTGSEDQLDPRAIGNGGGGGVLFRGASGRHVKLSP
jgi:hypothetical protein